jgi:FKBP-type peptidyl-prolyl cis-trans isomerase
MMKKKIFINGFIVFALLILGFVSCKTVDENSFQKEMEVLADYIKTNNISVKPTASGLYYIELKEGTGNFPRIGETVVVKYTGKLLNGTVFDSGKFSFKLGTGQVIKGWDEGIAMMKKGEIAQLIIPSDLAYGANGSGPIPPYSTLIFDVELILPHF